MAKMGRPRAGGMGMGGSFGSRKGGRSSIPRQRPGDGVLGSKASLGRAKGGGLGGLLGGLADAGAQQRRGGSNIINSNISSNISRSRHGGGGNGVGAAFIGSLLGSMLSSSNSGIDDLARGLGQSMAGVSEAETEAYQPQPDDGQPIESVAPGYPVECANCGATILPFEWTCQYCDGPRPREREQEDDQR